MCAICQTEVQLTLEGWEHVLPEIFLRSVGIPYHKALPPLVK